MDKQAVVRKEREKLAKIFEQVEPSKRELVETLIDDAAQLSGENAALRELLTKTGMVRVHPQHPELMKPVAAAEQYRKNVNTLAVVIKTLNGILNKNAIEEEDDLSEFDDTKGS